MKAEPVKSTAAQQLQKKEQTEQAPFFNKGGGQGEHARAAETPFFNAGNTGSFFQKKQDTACASPVQTKLSVGQPGDKYEQEADQVADNVVQRLSKGDTAPVAENGAKGNIQRKCTDCEKEEEAVQKMPEQISRKPIFESNAPEDALQRKCASCGKEMEGKMPALQKDSESTSSADSGGMGSLESSLAASKGGGAPLPADTRSSMESAMGADFSGVRVHTDSSAVQMSKDLGAHAFTHGSDVYFNAGKYDTGSSAGQHLLAHELTHTVQQGGAGLKGKLDTTNGEKEDAVQKSQNQSGDNTAEHGSHESSTTNNSPNQLRASSSVPSILQKVEPQQEDSEEKSVESPVQKASVAGAPPEENKQGEGIETKETVSPAIQLQASGRAQFRSCDAAEQSMIRAHLVHARNWVSDTIGKLLIMLSGRMPRPGIEVIMGAYQSNFGSLSDPREVIHNLGIIYQNFETVLTGLNRAIEYHCIECSDDLYARTGRPLPNQEDFPSMRVDTIDICDTWFRLNFYQRVTTLIHEVVHTDLNFRGDVYETSPRYGRLTWSFSQQNPDSYAVFARQVYHFGIASTMGPNLIVQQKSANGPNSVSDAASTEVLGGSTAISTMSETSGAIQREKAPPAPMPSAALDITTSFEPNAAWRAYLETNPSKHQIPVKVKIGTNYEGTIYVSPEKANSADPANFYKLSSEPKGGQFLEIKGIPFFEEFKTYKIIPVIYLNNWTRKDRMVKGYLTVMKGERAVTGVNKFGETFADNLDALGYLGIEKPKLPKIENTFEQGRLTFKATEMSTVVAGFLKAGGSIGIVSNVFTFELNANVDVKGVAQGQLDLRRDENGQFGGKVEIDANIQNIAAKLTVEYIKTGEAADVIIQGTGKIASEKFDGEVGFIVADQSKSKALMHAQLGVATVEEQKQTEQKSPKKSKRKETQVLVGWGSVTANITPWLAGTAKIGIDDLGHVTIVGEITVPNEVKLMEERGKKVTLFSLKIKGGYGVPLVGQIYLFAGINLFVNAGFGPLVLKNVRFEGVYSTDPAVLQKFSITGTLGINAFAVIGLEAEAGVGLTLIGHDIEAGINVSAAAGIRAYAEVSPTFEYVESQAEQGGKVGEAWLRGHFEAAAQLFLQLGGKFFVRLDSPWWSPAPDKTWDYPFDNVTYPIGDSMGIGGDVNWLVGSSDLPELNFTPIEFDPDKFTADVMADPPPGKGDGGEKKPGGDWTDQSQGNGNMEADPTADPSKAKGLDGQKKEDLSKLTDQERYMRALDEISKLSESANSMPMTYSVLDAKTKKIKSKYGVELVKIEGSKKDENVDIYVKHKTDDNGDHKINVKLITEAERVKLLEAAIQDLESKESAVVDQAGAIKKKDADHIAQQIPQSHPIVEHVAVIDGGDAWKFELDYGDMKKVSPGRPKAESDKVKEPDKDQKEKDNASLTPEEKQKKVDEGLKAIDEAEKPLLTNGAISKEEAETVAAGVKKTHPVFTSLTVVDGGKTWDYDYTASPGDKKTGEPKARPSELEGIKTPIMDQLSVFDPKVPEKYVNSFKITSNNSIKKKGIKIYVEDRAAKKLGKVVEGPALEAYNQESEFHLIGKNNRKFVIPGSDESRIPDFYLESKVVGDVKNVKYISFSSQMKDNVKIAQGKKGVLYKDSGEQVPPTNRFDLIVRAVCDNYPDGTEVSTPLEDAIRENGGDVYPLIQ